MENNDTFFKIWRCSLSTETLIFEKESMLIAATKENSNNLGKSKAWLLQQARQHFVSVQNSYPFLLNSGGYVVTIKKVASSFPIDDSKNRMNPVTRLISLRVVRLQQGIKLIFARAMTTLRTSLMKIISIYSKSRTLKFKADFFKQAPKLHFVKNLRVAILFKRVI